MAKHLDLGQRGEKLARSYLEDRGYEICETNWRYSRAEIDIIARHDHLLIFLEVKTRVSIRNGFPEDDVQTDKQRLLADAAAAYMDNCDYEGEIRFDILSVLIPPDRPAQIRHVVDAFFPGLF